MENLKKLINKKPGMVLYEYYCSFDDNFFWITIAQEKLICPFCGGYASINGEIPIKDLEIYENTITETPSQN